jgi:hypothetical protein
MSQPTGKKAALKEFRALNPRSEAVSDEDFAACAFLEPDDVVQVKYELVRRVRVDKIPVAQAAAAFGFCRQTFYAIAAALDAGGPAALVSSSPARRTAQAHRGGHGLRRTTRAGDASLRSAQLAEAVLERFGIAVHPRSVEKALARRREPRPAEEVHY